MIIENFDPHKTGCIKCNCLKFSQLGDVALGIGLKNCAFWCRLDMVDAYQSFIFFFWNKILNHWGKWTNTRDYPGQGIRPYGYHILHQFKKFKIDFCQKNVLHQWKVLLKPRKEHVNHCNSTSRSEAIKLSKLHIFAE